VGSLFKSIFGGGKPKALPPPVEMPDTGKTDDAVRAELSKRKRNRGFASTILTLGENASGIASPTNEKIGG